MWPIGISSFNKGPAEKKKTKKRKEKEDKRNGHWKLNTKIKLKNYITADQKGTNKESNNTKKLIQYFQYKKETNKSTWLFLKASPPFARKKMPYLSQTHQ